MKVSGSISGSLMSLGRKEKRSVKEIVKSGEDLLVVLHSVSALLPKQSP